MRCLVDRRTNLVLTVAIIVLGLPPASAETNGRILWQYETGG
jgi:hypothetical protein